MNQNSYYVEWFQLEQQKTTKSNPEKQKEIVKFIIALNL